MQVVREAQQQHALFLSWRHRPPGGCANDGPLPAETGVKKSGKNGRLREELDRGREEKKRESLVLACEKSWSRWRVGSAIDEWRNGSATATIASDDDER